MSEQVYSRVAAVLVLGFLLAGAGAWTAYGALAASVELASFNHGSAGNHGNAGEWQPSRATNCRDPAARFVGFHAR